MAAHLLHNEICFGAFFKQPFFAEKEVTIFCAAVFNDATSAPEFT